MFHRLAAVPHGHKVAAAAINMIKSPDPTVAWADEGVSPHALAACLPADVEPPRTWTRLGVRWHVDAHGHPTQAHATIPGATDELAHCIDGVLATAAFACPQAGADVDVTAILSLAVLDH